MGNYIITQLPNYTLTKNKKAALLGAALCVLRYLFFALTFTQQHVILIANNKDNNKDEAKYN
ncbi:MAG: hypothetical protein BroJett015_09260 [Chloroflexota bacterium]|nr:hypothetical protein [Chloroflexota bacterium]GIK55263.1 MAG: hypothetical protein BroJett015_09260 [Chloroflexota bacterium]